MTETIKISKVANGYVADYARGAYVAKDKKELTTIIAEALYAIIPIEDNRSVEINITINNLIK